MKKYLPILILLSIVSFQLIAQTDYEHIYEKGLSVYLTSACETPEYLQCLNTTQELCLTELGQAITQCQNEHRSALPTVLNSAQTFIYLQTVYECSILRHVQAVVERTDDTNICALEAIE